MALTDDGGDGGVEEALRSAPDTLWRALSEAARSYMAAPAASQVRWEHPKAVHSELRGEEPVSVQLSYPRYSGMVNRIVALFYDVGVVSPFDWPGRDGPDRYRGGAGLAAAPIAEAVRLATAVRAEKFCDGALGGAIEDRTFQAILERLLRWYETEESRRPPPSPPGSSGYEDAYDYSVDLRYRYRFDRRWGSPEPGGRIVCGPQSRGPATPSGGTGRRWPAWSLGPAGGTGRR